jgi:hypothetical protein
MTQKNLSFNIDIDWDAPDGGYSVLRSKRMAKFVFKSLEKGNNLIQTRKPFTTHKTKLCLRSKRFTSWPKTPTWDEIKCVDKGDWLKSTPCEIGKNKKMFVKYKSNEYAAGFAIYLLMVITGEITVKQHLEFLKVMKKTMNLVTIHNEDVDWFHLKEVKIE